MLIQWGCGSYVRLKRVERNEEVGDSDPSFQSSVRREM